MSWDPTLPAGSTRIRLAPGIFQARWQNIQQGQVPCTKWTLAERVGNPGAVADSGLLFTKAGGAGNTELFFKDDASNTARLTRKGGVGYFGQSLYGNQVIMNSSTEYANTQNGFCSSWGITDAGGMKIAGYNFASSSPTGSSTTVVFDTPLLNTNYSVVITVDTSGGTTSRTAVMTNKTTGGFTFRTYEENSSDLRGCNFAVFGGLI